MYTFLQVKIVIIRIKCTFYDQIWRSEFALYICKVKKMVNGTFSLYLLIDLIHCTKSDAKKE